MRSEMVLFVVAACGGSPTAARLEGSPPAAPSYASADPIVTPRVFTSERPAIAPAAPSGRPPGDIYQIDSATLTALLDRAPRT